jgi:DNA-binding NarL/FixJ family response regulator
VVEQTIRVLIADDEAAMRASLADLVASDGSFEVVGTARDADEAIALAESRRPDVALVDVRMPAGGGQRVVEELRRRAPEIRVLAHTVMGERESVVGMLHGGAVGYLLKGTASTEEILSAIRRAARGQPSLSSEVVSGLVADLAGHLERGASSSPRLCTGEGLYAGRYRSQLRRFAETHRKRTRGQSPSSIICCHEGRLHTGPRPSTHQRLAPSWPEI